MRNIPLTTLTGAVAPLLRANIDTDAIAPSSVTLSVDASDLSSLLFREWRFDANGAERPEFVLNQQGRRASVFMVALDNFGCGSSRETAPWALRDFGIRCVIAPSFGSIFKANCIRNGVAPVVLDRHLVERLGYDAERDPTIGLALDLPAQTLTATNGFAATFDIDPGAKRMLVEGLDAVGLTLTRLGDIEAFRDADRRLRPWIYGAVARTARK
jgi:3-isopropylmalate/(R)-2-methylmalate dehydratase small subunit